MQTGKVLWYDPVKGYGFIAQDNGEEDIFVHFRYIKIKNSTRVELEKEQLVTYKVEDGKKGLHAVDVEVIN